MCSVVKMSPEFNDRAKSQIHEAEALDEEDTPCDCGECRECDDRAYDHYVEEQTDAQIERMHGIED